MADTTSSLTTYELVRDAVDVLEGGDVILGNAQVDYAAAEMLRAFLHLHVTTALDLNAGMDAVREFARLVVEGWPL